MRRIESILELSKLLAEPGELDGVRVVSFDIFNTVLQRRCAPPDVIRDAVLKKLANSCEALKNMSLEDVISFRSEVIAKLELSAANDGYDATYSFSEMVKAWVTLACGKENEQLAKSAMHEEIELEISMTYAHPSWVSILKKLKAAGKKIVFCSDMYFSESQIRQLLSAHGLDQYFDAGYVSSDYRLLKWTGRLFEKLLTTENVDPESVLHVGDSILADGKMAQESGIRSWILSDSGDRRRTLLLEKNFAIAKKSPEWLSIYANLVSRQGYLHEKSLPFVFGYDVFGPILEAFSRHVLARCEELSITQIYFLSRDGRLPYEVSEILLKDRNSNFKLDYLFISRKCAFEATKNNNKKRQLLESYLEQVGFFSSPKVAIIDVGWNGSIQKYLNIAFQNRKDFPEIFGFYFGLRPGSEIFDFSSNQVESVFSDPEKMDWHGSAIFSVLHVIEVILAAQHGSLLGYDVLDGRTKPLLEGEDAGARREEKANDPLVVEIQDGIREYAVSYSSASRIGEPSADSDLLLAKGIINQLARAPSPKLADMLLGATFSDANKGTVEKIGPSLMLQPIGTRILEVLNRSHRSGSWGRGTIATVDIPLLGFIYGVLAASKLRMNLNSQKTDSEMVTNIAEVKRSDDKGVRIAEENFERELAEYRDWVRSSSLFPKEFKINPLALPITLTQHVESIASWVLASLVNFLVANEGFKYGSFSAINIIDSSLDPRNLRERIARKIRNYFKRGEIK